MQLNIKNEEAVRLAHELARQHGETVTQAVLTALRTSKSQRDKSKAGLAKWLGAMSEMTGPLMENGKTSKQMMDELYDPETGLPV